MTMKKRWGRWTKARFKLTSSCPIPTTNLWKSYYARGQKALRNWKRRRNGWLFWPNTRQWKTTQTSSWALSPRMNLRNSSKKSHMRTSTSSSTSRRQSPPLRKNCPTKRRACSTYRTPMTRSWRKKKWRTSQMCKSLIKNLKYSEIAQLLSLKKSLDLFATRTCHCTLTCSSTESRYSTTAWCNLWQTSIRCR